MARYGGSLAWQYRLPVKSVVVLLSEGGCPDTVPEMGVQHIGKTVLTHPYSTVKLWELDPEHVLAAEDPGLWPWALLMRLDREGARTIGAKVAETGDERWIARFLSLGSLRYDRTEVEEMLGGVVMGLGEAMIEAIEERAEARGKAEEARRILKMALARLFPGLETHPDLDRIEDARVLESLLLENVFQADDCDVVHRAITAAARG